ncbi:MAG: hypothetical protein E6I22_06690, partial [Chloroflexi bacterium]
MTDTLLELIDRTHGPATVREWWQSGGSPLRAHGLPPSAVPVFLSWLSQRSRRPVLALLADPEATFSDSQSWLSPRAVVFPAVETLPFDRLAPDEETVRRRLEAIDALGQGGPLVCFSSWTALTRPTLSREALRRWTFTLKPGDRQPLSELTARLVVLGYRREPLVQSRGEFSLRGGILDIFPPDLRRPVRAEYFGDDLESLREFELESQGSVGSVAQLRVLPAAEVLLTPQAVQLAEASLADLDLNGTLAEVRDDWTADVERLRAGAYFDGVEGFQSYLEPGQPTLFDHLPADAILVLVDSARNLRLAEQREQELADLVAVEVD